MSCCQRLIALRCGAHPLNGEVLERQQQLVEVASRDFDLVVGKDEAQNFSLTRANEGRGNEMLKREDVKFAAGRFETQARGWGFTLPARWCGRDGWVGGFRTMFHEVAGFV